MDTNPQFLIIDDSEIDRIITNRLIRVRLDITDVFFAENGAKGIEVIRSEREKFTDLVILLDIQMPEMDGFQFLDAIQQADPAIMDVARIFMLSSTLDREDIERARRHPFVRDLLGKPLDVEELRFRMKNSRRDM